MLTGKSAIITGSTSGIGFGIAHKLAGQGCNIMLNGFATDQEIAAIKTELTQKYNIRVGFAAADISKSDQAIAMIKQTEAEFGQIDILVNNAGIQFVAPVTEFPIEKWDAVLSINLSGAFYTMHAALAGMQSRGFGRIINIASTHGLVASPNKSAYVAAKHGLIGLTKVVALENATLNITCNAICPGWVYTPLVKKQIEDNAKLQNISIEQATTNLLSDKQPSLRFATAEEIGDLVVFLSSESARSITGIALPVDGGWTAR